MTDLPWSVAIELVDGCNRLCDFCGLAFADKKIKFMDLNLIEEVAKDLKSWGREKLRIEFAMHGEPTLHPKLIQIINIFRTNLPKSQIQITTNGIIVSRKGELFVLDMFKAGLNILLVDTYTNYNRIVELGKNLTSAGITYCDYMHNNKTVNPWHYNNIKTKAYVVMDDIGNTHNNTTRKLGNNAGNVDWDKVKKYGLFPLIKPHNKKCVRPFRQICIHHDGTVPICCWDFRHEHVMGKFPEKSLIDIWNGLSFSIVREFLYNKNRNLLPCYRCDYSGGFYQGFIKKQPLSLTKEESIKALQDNWNKYRSFAHKSAKDLLFPPIKTNILVDGFRR